MSTVRCHVVLQLIVSVCLYESIPAFNIPLLTSANVDGRYLIIYLMKHVYSNVPFCR